MPTLSEKFFLHLVRFYSVFNLFSPHHQDFQPLPQQQHQVEVVEVVEVVVMEVDLVEEVDPGDLVDPEEEPLGSPEVCC